MLRTMRPLRPGQRATRALEDRQRSRPGAAGTAPRRDFPLHHAPTLQPQRMRVPVWTRAWLRPAIALATNDLLAVGAEGCWLHTASHGESAIPPWALVASANTGQREPANPDDQGLAVGDALLFEPSTGDAAASSAATSEAFAFDQEQRAVEVFELIDQLVGQTSLSAQALTLQALPHLFPMMRVPDGAPELTQFVEALQQVAQRSHGERRAALVRFTHTVLQATREVIITGTPLGELPLPQYLIWALLPTRDVIPETAATTQLLLEVFAVPPPTQLAEWMELLGQLHATAVRLPAAAGARVTSPHADRLPALDYLRRRVALRAAAATTEATPDRVAMDRWLAQLHRRDHELVITRLRQPCYGTGVERRRLHADIAYVQEYLVEEAVDLLGWLHERSDLPRSTRNLVEAALERIAQQRPVLARSALAPLLAHYGRPQDGPIARWRAKHRYAALKALLAQIEQTPPLVTTAPSSPTLPAPTTSAAPATPEPALPATAPTTAMASTQPLFRTLDLWVAEQRRGIATVAPAILLDAIQTESGRTALRLTVAAGVSPESLAAAVQQVTTSQWLHATQGVYYGFERLQLVLPPDTTVASVRTAVEPVWRTGIIRHLDIQPFAEPDQHESLTNTTLAPVPMTFEKPSLLQDRHGREACGLLAELHATLLLRTIGDGAHAVIDLPLSDQAAARPRTTAWETLSPLLFGESNRDTIATAIRIRRYRLLERITTGGLLAAGIGFGLAFVPAFGESAPFIMGLGCLTAFTSWRDSQNAYPSPSAALQSTGTITIQTEGRPLLTIERTNPQPGEYISTARLHDDHPAAADLRQRWKYPIPLLPRA